MRVFGGLWRSTVGKKVLVAVSGLALWIWVVLHVLGNLTIFSGAAAADGYAAALQRVPAALWAARAALATAAAVHVAGVVSLARASRTARPRHAAVLPRRPSAFAARSMRLGGALLLAFVGYHVLHLTFGVLHPGFTPGRVYDNVVAGLRPAWVAAVYVGAAALLGLHLFHGLWAAVRSLGLRPDAAAERRRPAVAVLAGAMALGFAAVPIAVLAGWLR
jgi:succinate dehydrogenase / fumarate reductase cytochrome b subunit